MHSRDKLGAIGEAKVIAELIKQDYIVFTQFDGKAPFDLVAYKDDKLYKVSVKSTANLINGSYLISIGAGRHDGRKSWRVAFNNNSIDILAIYVLPEDKVILIDAKTVKPKHQLSIKQASIV